jgi:hypothetical protein
MGAIKNTPAGKEGEGKQSGCKRRVESGCALQIIGNSSTINMLHNNRITSMFFITKKDLKQFLYSETGTIQAGDKTLGTTEDQR